ncbi:tetratricopeptide repeat protein [Paraburkholderia flava]|uniref:tetratricopeptide repeat protein n=1 Tax=Paraburkholderia flava TaxID=2547393 RepID=UPI00105E036D|nr:tetratricopeptide repeat protein [Paraburkholderia flava]
MRPQQHRPSLLPCLVKQTGEWLKEGSQLAKAGNHEEAVAYFDRIIDAYGKQYDDKGTRYYSAHWQIESLMYLVSSANAHVKAVVAPGTWAYAWYLKSYALTGLGRQADAKAAIQRAVDLSPRNAQFLEEWGTLLELEKNWPQAMKTFQDAKDDARQFSPPDVKNAELGRAWRGQAYVDVELNRLDEAEALYQQCLQLDPHDARAAAELQGLRRQRAATGSSQ